MINAQEITKAIGAHGMWKRRLEMVVKEKKSDTPPEKVEPDNQCEFGKWLYSLPVSDQSSPHFKKVQTLHASFHKEAAQVIRLALKGQMPEAEKSMALGGAYTNVSSRLTVAMMEWKNSIGG